MDQPDALSEASVLSPFVVSGWAIPPPHAESVQIEVDVDGALRAKLVTALPRPDVEDKYPERAEARWSGFAGEVFVDDLAGSLVEVRLRAVFDGEKIPLAQFHTQIAGLARQISPRQRNWRFEDILVCPVCLASLDETDVLFQCRGCKRAFNKRRGVPVFARRNEVIESRLLETTPTNPNAQHHTRIIESNALVLDLGAGNPRESDHYPNVVFHEFVHYAHTDVISLFDRLPYKDGIFDAVISKAAFEHFPRPWQMADEIYRVLRAGGIVHVETAFMQPVHGAPYHFFNMTLDGVKEIFKRFKLVQSGIQRYQSPVYGFRMQVDVLLQHLRSDDWIRRFKELRELLPEDFDSVLDTKGREKLAAGVFLEGIKPGSTD